MWPFRRRAVRPMSDQDVAEVLTQLTKAVRDLRDDHEALHAKYLKLRGRVYAIWGREDGEAPTKPAQVAMTRDDLRRQLATSGRFVPGRAPQHSE